MVLDHHISMAPQLLIGVQPGWWQQAAAGTPPVHGDFLDCMIYLYASEILLPVLVGTGPLLFKPKLQC
jgi:hypothetical protein